MNAQLTLLYQHRSQESRSAAESIKSYAPTMRDEVLQIITSQGPLTDNEIIIEMGTPSARPRRIELERMGLVRKVGIVKQRNGRTAALWQRVMSPVNGLEN